MRVLHLGKYYPPDPGGIERFCAELVAAQAAAGLAPAVLAHRGPAARATSPPPGVRLVDSYGRLLFVPVSPGWPLAFRRALRELRPELLHLHLPNPSVFWLLGMPAACALPWVVHWHADIPDDSSHRGLRGAYPLYRRFERRVLERATTVIATSQRYAAASRVLRPFAPKLRVVPLGLGAAPAPAAIAPTWPSGRLRLLAVGRLSFYKGFELLLESIAGVADASLLLIGSGEQRAALQRKVREAGLGERVRLLGHVDDATLEAAYRSCDVFCLSSLDRSEAFGLVLLEAMRAGKPVLASDIPGSGVSEVVADGASGDLLPVGNVAAWRQAIERLAAEPERRAALGQAGRRRWETAFGIDAVAARITPIYREALGDRPADATAAPARAAATAPGATAGD